MLYHHQRGLSSTILGLLVVSSLTLVACGNSNDATPTPVRIASLTSPIALGGMATLTAQTSPGTACSIVYKRPSGKTSTAQELTPKTAGSDGSVSWTWLISTGTSPVGAGTVTVTCNGASAQASIVIGQ